MTLRLILETAPQPQMRSEFRLADGQVRIGARRRLRLEDRGPADVRVAAALRCARSGRAVSRDR